MKGIIIFVAIFTFCFDPTTGRPNGDDEVQRTPSQIVMDSVHSSDRSNFVAFHISRALDIRGRTDGIFKPSVETIPSEKREGFAKIPTPRNFSTNLLDWTELELVPFKNGHKNDKGGVHAAEGASMNVCFPNGCVDPNDAGSLCCPF